MRRARVIGVGSPFGADRAGWQVVDALRAADAAGGASPGWTVELLTLDRPGAALVDALSGCAVAIVIDALDDAAGAGRASEVDAGELAQTGAGLSSHALGVTGALALAKALGDAPDALVLVAVHVAPAEDPGDAGDARALERAVARAAALVGERLRSL